MAKDQERRSSRRRSKRSERGPPPSAFQSDGIPPADAGATPGIDTGAASSTNATTTVVAPPPQQRDFEQGGGTGTGGNGRSLTAIQQQQQQQLEQDQQLDDEIAAEVAAAAQAAVSSSSNPHHHSHSQHGIRFPTWIALSIFSLVSFISILSKIHDFDQGVGPAQKFAMICCIISLLIGILSVIGYLFFRGLFMSQLPEMILAVLSLLLWTAGLPVIMNAQYSIAVGYTQVVNANLFFFSWGCFLCSFWMVSQLIRDGVGYDIYQADPKMAKWWGLILSSIVIMGASSQIFRAFECFLEEMKDVAICKRTKFSMSAGVVGFWTAAFLTYASHVHLTNPACEVYGSALILSIWCFGLGLITFGDGPGHAIGNLYFATWISFTLSIFLFAECFQNYLVSTSANLGLMQQQERRPGGGGTLSSGSDDEFMDQSLSDDGDGGSRPNHGATTTPPHDLRFTVDDMVEGDVAR